MYNGVWVLDGSNSPKRRCFCRSFAAIMGGGGWWRRVGVPDEPKMVSRFYCTRMRVERGKAPGLGAVCGTWRTGSQPNTFPLWNHRPPEATMETMCIVTRGSEFLSHGRDGSRRASICKGNDHIFTLKHVAHQTSKMTWVKERLLVHSRTL